MRIKEMRMNMKTDLTPVGHVAQTNPNVRRSSMQEALSQRRVGRIAKPKLLNQNTSQMPIMPNSEASVGRDGISTEAEE